MYDIVLFDFNQSAARVAGEPIQISGRLLQKESTPVDVTGWSALFVLRDAAGTELLRMRSEDGAIIMGTTDGTYALDSTLGAPPPTGAVPATPETDTYALEFRSASGALRGTMAFVEDLT